jgi:hypothetical protein
MRNIHRMAATLTTSGTDTKKPVINDRRSQDIGRFRRLYSQ